MSRQQSFWSENTGQVSWLTPMSYIDALGEFDLDPCGWKHHQTAKRIIQWPEDGLAARWQGRVWLNPPYGRYVSLWLRKLADHGWGTALTFARTDTRWFHDMLESCRALFFLKARIRFLTVDLVPAERGIAPSVFAAYGAADVDRLADSGLDGSLVLVGNDQWSVIGFEKTWAQLVVDGARAVGPDFELSDLYDVISQSPKRSGRKHWKAKVRQEVQRGPFKRLGRGTWRLI